MGSPRSIVVVVFLSLPGPASADFGSPGFSRVPHDFVFEITTDFSQYRFWLVSQRGAEPLDLAPGHPVQVNGENRGGSHRIAYVAAAPVGLVEEMGQAAFANAVISPNLPWHISL